MKLEYKVKYMVLFINLFVIYLESCFSHLSISYIVSSMPLVQLPLLFPPSLSYFLHLFLPLSLSLIYYCLPLTVKVRTVDVIKRALPGSPIGMCPLSLF